MCRVKCKIGSRMKFVFNFIDRYLGRLNERARASVCVHHLLSTPLMVYNLFGILREAIDDWYFFFSLSLFTYFLPQQHLPYQYEKEQRRAAQFETPSWQHGIKIWRKKLSVPHLPHGHMDTAIVRHWTMMEREKDSANMWQGMCPMRTHNIHLHSHMFGVRRAMTVKF